MGNNEAGVISEFKDALREFAETSKRHFKDFPLGGQDRYTLGDDFWVTYDHFAIVESKWSQNQLRTELDKHDRVKALCEALQNEPDMAVLHAKCHRVAWRDSRTKRLMSQTYRDKICFEEFQATCTTMGTPQSPLTIDEFGEEFFGDPPSHCLPIDDFITYINWLTKIVTGREREILVLARSRDNDGFTISEQVKLSDLGQRLRKRPTTPPKTNPTTPKNKKFKN
ncbi:hypothetical protein [Burkholderia cenocepacia]|jgi:hypothetical protein|uniref:hypothetical protein n=1 Tax=Burkholderia cenocepacia TaxID=95486 RepID=UPI000B32F94D|nr:hypothetical protein [Burkholderia cenocepacia]MBN3501285.1 hypothetical protein [Burkholderia cenocepacia]MCO1392808.1 hypothetical protein [Burkholderia cenocepacia]MCO1406375.1 hypothetical protein [Burkholderia cenocepacia]MCW3588152.1 hypothetical protein [Burkholderia cenocepacia]MCW3627986.1 hypothetical protein [Burkholderia cenocepacia]